ncbi:MAG: AI-2E family transporter [Pseudomonadota bacterium]
MSVAGARNSSGARETNARQLTSWSLATLAGIAVIAAAKLASEIVVPTVLAGMFAITLTPVVASLEKLRIPSALAAALVVLSAMFAISSTVYILAPSVEDWRIRAPSIIRSIEWELRDIEREIKESVEDVTGNDNGDEEKSATEAVMASGQGLVTDVVLRAPEILASALYIAFLCYFFLLERATLGRFILSLGPNGRVRRRMSRTMRAVRRDVARYLLTIAFVNAVLGVAVALVLWQMGIPSPILWGVTAALLNFMPYIGPLFLNAIIFVVGVSAFGDMLDALYPVAALFALNVVEGNVLTPLVVGRRSRVGPLSIFLAVAFFAWLWGVLGALLAVPLLIIWHSVWRGMRGEKPGAAAARDHRVPDHAAVPFRRPWLSRPLKDPSFGPGSVGADAAK